MSICCQRFTSWEKEAFSLTRARSCTTVLPQSGPSFSMRPKAAIFTPSKRGASQPPILFCSPLRTAQRGPLLFDRLRSPHTGAPCVERRTCGAAQMGRGGFAARDGAAGAVQERTRQGHRSPISYMKREWAPGPTHSEVKTLPLRGETPRSRENQKDNPSVGEAATSLDTREALRGRIPQAGRGCWGTNLAL